VSIPKKEEPKFEANADYMEGLINDFNSFEQQLADIGNDNKESILGDENIISTEGPPAEEDMDALFKKFKEM
jgi:hypothetical protein